MNVGAIFGFINLFCVGLLAGEEFIIRYGVRGPVASLEDRSHIKLRQALILKMRVLVPTVFALSVLAGISTTFLDGYNLGFGFRCAGLLALLTFIVVTLTGTVPINEAALTWDPAAPPTNWRTLISKWERLDNVRCWAAITALALFLTAIML